MTLNMQPRIGGGSLNWTGYLLVFGTVAFTVYGQLITKQQVAQLSRVPPGLAAAWYFAQQIVTRPLLLSGFVAAFLAALCWMGALTRFELSYAYPFMSLNFVLVLALSVPCFGETLTAAKLVGLGLIILGVVVTSRG